MRPGFLLASVFPITCLLHGSHCTKKCVPDVGYLPGCRCLKMPQEKEKTAYCLEVIILCLPLPSITFNIIFFRPMAIVNSLGIGKGKKSAGELTYRDVRGRTIASRRVIQNLSNTALQNEQRVSFRDASKMLSIAAFFINAGTERSKYGSHRNNFYHLNKTIFRSLAQSNVEVPATPYGVLSLLNSSSAGTGYMTYGQANGIVSIRQVEGQPDEYTYTLFAVNRNEVNMNVFFIAEDGQVKVSKVPLDSDSPGVTVQYDAETMIMTITLSGLPMDLGFTPGDVLTAPVITTNLGILKTQSFPVYTKAAD